MGKNYHGIVSSIKQFQKQTSNKTPEGEIKVWNKGQSNIIGSSGAFGVIGGGALKLVGYGLKGLWNFGKLLAGNPGGAINATRYGLINARIYGETISKNIKGLETQRKKLEASLKKMKEVNQQSIRK